MEGLWSGQRIFIQWFLKTGAWKIPSTKFWLCNEYD
jgi:hypothetical protein